MKAVLANFQRGQRQLERRVGSLEKFPEQADKDIEGWCQEIELRNKNTTSEKFFAAEGRLPQAPRQGAASRSSPSPS